MRSNHATDKLFKRGIMKTKFPVSDDPATQRQVAAILLRNDLQTVNDTIEKINLMSASDARNALVRVLCSATHVTLPGIVAKITETH